MLKMLIVKCERRRCSYYLCNSPDESWGRGRWACVVYELAARSSRVSVWEGVSRRVEESGVRWRACRGGGCMRWASMLCCAMSSGCRWWYDGAGERGMVCLVCSGFERECRSGVCYADVEMRGCGKCWEMAVRGGSDFSGECCFIGFFWVFI